MVTWQGSDGETYGRGSRAGLERVHLERGCVPPDRVTPDAAWVCPVCDGVWQASRNRDGLVWHRDWRRVASHVAATRRQARRDTFAAMAVVAVAAVVVVGLCWLAAWGVSVLR